MVVEKQLHLEDSWLIKPMWGAFSVLAPSTGLCPCGSFSWTLNTSMSGRFCFAQRVLSEHDNKGQLFKNYLRWGLVPVFNLNSLQHLQKLQCQSGYLQNVP